MHKQITREFSFILVERQINIITCNKFLRVFDRYYVGDDIYFRVTSRIYSGAIHSVIFCARKYYFEVTLVLNPIMLWLWQQVTGFVPQD